MISTEAASALSRELKKRDRDWRKPAVTIEMEGRQQWDVKYPDGSVDLDYLHESGRVKPPSATRARKRHIATLRGAGFWQVHLPDQEAPFCQFRATPDLADFLHAFAKAS
jgi:hypothetical protein